MKQPILPGWKKDFHRPVPKEFSRTKAPDDLMYFEQVAVDLDEFYAKYQGEIIYSDYLKFTTVLQSDAKCEVVDIDGDKVIRFEIPSAPDKPTSDMIEFSEPLEGFREGDTLVARFFVRNVERGMEDGFGKVQFQAEEEGTFKKAVFVQELAGSEWTKVYIPFSAKDNHTKLAFRLGFIAQTIEIKDFAILNYGNQFLPKDVPLKSVCYSQLEKGAPWRKEALNRIEKIRKGDFRIVVCDKDGAPVKNAMIKASMYEHQFEFGTAISGKFIDEPDMHKAFSRDFNAAVSETYMKWGPYVADKGDRADKQVNILKELGCKYMRGHSLVWEKLRSGIGTNLVPPFVGDIMHDKKKMDDAIISHMEHIITKYKDYVTDWDVANEMSANTLFRDIHGQKYIKDWFNWATEINPQGCYFYNEYQHGNEFFDILKFMQDNNVKCDHIGLQSHYDGFQPMPDELFALWDKITSYGFRLKVTELSISNHDQTLMGNYMRDFMIAAFSYEKMDGIYMWGYWDDSNIKPYAPLYRSDWSLRESGQVYEDLVYNKWWTEEEAITDGKGAANIRGFYGNYDITVEHNGKTKTVSADFYKNEENIIKIVL
ncbi:MAG: hypothetical protein E7396_02440 [Ruminococcaceae bacterium]|nr:hypothetical protein [Oscillospiraceae bacterium]